VLPLGAERPYVYEVGRVTCTLAVVVAATCAGAEVASAASGPKTIASYCSPSGDVCYGVISRGGAVYLEITTAARYFGRYKLCVRPPGGGATGLQRCGSFPVVRRSGSLWGSSVKYSRQFPVTGPGTYRVTWKLRAQPLGPTLRFRLPLTGPTSG
jgi:hypothetical protein